MRDLTAPPPVTFECPVAFPPYYSGDMGVTRADSGYSYAPWTIPEGPNRGWSYIANQSAPWHPTQIEIILNALLAPGDTSAYGSEFFKFSTGCTRDELRKDVEDHERTHANSIVQNLNPFNEWLEGVLAYGLSPDEWNQRLGPGGDLRTEMNRRYHFATLEHRVYPELLQQFPPNNCGIKGLVPNPQNDPS